MKRVYDLSMSESSLQRSSAVLFAAAEKLQLEPKFATNYGLISVTYKGITKYIYVSKTLVNTQISAYLSTNKHATRTLLGLHNLPNIPYLTPQNSTELLHFFSEHKPIVMKPTMGQRAEGVRLLKTQAEIEELSPVELKGCIFEKYIVGKEVRYVILDNEVIAVQEKIYEGDVYSPTGSRRRALSGPEWKKELIEHALSATKILGLGFSAVDFKVNPQGEIFILEVNSAPALWRFEQPDEGEPTPVALLLLEATMKRWDTEKLTEPYTSISTTNGK